MKKIKKVVIIGTGAMGSGIAQVFLWGGYQTTIVDISEEQLKKCVKNLNRGFEKLQQKQLLEKGKLAEDYLSLLTSSSDLQTALQNADFVIETVSENLEIKKKIFEICGQFAPLDCILASNTSTMSINALADISGRPENVIGMHFANPVPIMKIVEIIYGDKSSDLSIEIAVEIGEKLPCIKGKRVIVIAYKDVPGFIISRINAPLIIYFHWIYDFAAENNIPWNELDSDFADMNLPMLPLELTDFVGIDIAVNSLKYYQKTLSPEFQCSKVVEKMMNEGKLGAKTGQGFYNWANGRPKIDTSKKAGIINPEVIQALRMNEGCRLIELGVVKDWKAIDITVKYAYNNIGPFEGGGLKKYKEWSKLLDDLATQIGKEYLRPCELMKTGNFLKYS
jgi:enoyl-CoA hydratase / 3-hydroxyacyl-CoA dehydrogenase